MAEQGEFKTTIFRNNGLPNEQQVALANCGARIPLGIDRLALLPVPAMHQVRKRASGRHVAFTPRESPQ